MSTRSVVHWRASSSRSSISASSHRLHKARDEAQSQLQELTQHISGDSAKLSVLREAVAAAEPQLEQLREDHEFRQESLREAEARLADWQQRWETHNRDTGEASRAGEVERTRVDYLDRQALEADRRREALVNERAGLDLDALAGRSSRSNCAMKPRRPRWTV